MHPIDFIKESFTPLGIHLTDQQAQQFYRFYELLIEKNKVMNLTAITEFEEVVQKHFVDSCLTYPHLKTLYSDFSKVSMIDVGTGAGFPGIPLKIVFPEMSVCLLDSLNKRILFLDEVIADIGLTNIQTVHARAEDGGRNPQLREQFDLCVARAVANLSVLSEYCLPFIKPNGYFIPYKAGNAQEEIQQSKKAIFLLSSKLKSVHETTLPDSDIQRTVITIQKQQTLAKKYPRKAGLPSKNPL
ncbi:MAG: 16S rRNA (guanine(527)-N(7))-methyltransferase RsmG [Lachnospiraceae bacterium]